jgi:hypothetical protein
MQNELLSQIFTGPPQMVLVSTAGVLELERRRPVDVLQELLQVGWAGWCFSACKLCGKCLSCGSRHGSSVPERSWIIQQDIKCHCAACFAYADMACSPVVLQERSGEKLKQFFEAYGPAEAAAMCYLLATGDKQSMVSLSTVIARFVDA